MASPRRIRYKDRCARCSATVYPGDRGYYDRDTRKVHCVRCGPDPVLPAAADVAGSSAGREYRRRRAAREERLGRQLPIGGRLLARLTEPPHQRAWAVGEEGERRGAEALMRRLNGSGVVLLNDRRKPRSRANIDHIAVGPGGVTVIDSKKLKGPIRVVKRGFFGARQELRVAGRERSPLVAAVEDQVRAVRAVLSERGLVEVDVRGGLQFVDADLPLLGLQSIRGVTLGSPRKIAKVAKRAGALTADDVRRVVAVLDATMRPA
jgi:hypothetical protein